MKKGDKPKGDKRLEKWIDEITDRIIEESRIRRDKEE